MLNKLYDMLKKYKEIYLLIDVIKSYREFLLLKTTNIRAKFKEIYIITVCKMLKLLLKMSLLRRHTFHERNPLKEKRKREK